MQRFSPFGAVVILLFLAVLVQIAPAQNIGTVRVNGAPQINSGRVEGNVQQMTGANTTLNSGAVITGDLLVPGTPTLIKNGTMNFGGTIVGTGSTSPSNYQVILNGAITLGHLRTRTNPVGIPALSPVPTPTGTRTVAITAAGQSIGNFSTLRSLTLNGNVGQYAIPAGTYGDFIANGGSGFTLGVAGATQAAVYNLQHLTLNGQTNIIVLGPVVINVANGFTANGTAGTSVNPARLKLNIVSGGFTLNGGCTIYGYVNAPNGTVIINGAAKLVGGCISAGLTVNATGLLQLFDATSFDNQPPAVAITSPAAGAVFNAGSAINLVASATDSDGSVAKVEFFAGTTKLGEATSSPWTYTWRNAIPGSYQLTAIATDNLGAKTTSAAVSISVNAPPTVGLTAPANQSVFQAGSVILLTANAADGDGTIQKVEFFADGTKLGEKTTAPYSFSWTNALTGPHALTARAIDNNGAQTVSATVNIRVNAAPAVAMTAPANGSVAQAGSTIPLAASAGDSDGTITKVEFYAGATKVGEDTSSPYQFNWSNAPAGQHSLTAKATDNDGAQTVSAPINIRVNALPSATMTAPANGSVAQAGSTISLAANSGDSDGTITKVEFYAGATKVGEDTSSPYQFSWSNAPAGQHSLTAKATDNDGAQTISAPINIRVNALPSATMTAPANGSVAQAGSIIPLAANASDSDGTITKVEFYAGVTKVGEDTTAPYQFNWSNGAAGQYSLTARATDNDGAQGTSAPVTLTINAPPAVAITAPAAAQVFNPGATISITASPSDPDGTVTKVEFFSGATKIGEADASPWAMSWPAPAPGVYQLSAKATDDRGAQTTSSSVSITINAPPAVAISSPLDQAVVQPGNPILLTAHASDSDGTITKVEFFAGATKLGESFSAPFTFSWGNAASGSYTITAKATDNASASAVSAPIHLRVNALPAISLTNPAQGATFNTGDAITLSASATDPDDGITKVEFFAGSAKIGEAIASPYSITWSGAPEGASTLTARAEDGSGASATSAPVTINVTTVNTQLTVDAGPDRLISLPGAAALEGQVLLNGGPPGPEVALAWSLQSGPGPVTFSAPNSSTTSASFTQAGNYVLRLTASNIDGANFDAVAVTVLAAPQAGPDSPVSNQGREFWLAFLTGEGGHEQQYAGADVIISSEVAATGTVEIFRPFQTFDPPGWEVTRTVKNFSVEAGKNTVVDVATSFPPSYNGQYEQALQSAIHIQADKPVAVHALNYERASTDGSLILPTGLLGRDYFVMSYTNSGSFVPGDPSLISGTQFAVVATKNDTEITITPTASTAAHPAGQPFTVTLQTGDVYRMINLNDPLGDYSGTRVQSNKPVAVFGGHKCASVPGATAACDHLYEQMPPTNLWGRHFVTLPLETRIGDRFRLLAANNDTRVSINGEIVATLGRGEFYETVLTQASSILASQPILLSQFAQSTRVDFVTGDPFLMIVPPFEEFGRHYILSTAQVRLAGQYSDVYNSFLSIVVDSAHTSQVSVNGQLLLASQFAPIGGSGLSGASIPVAKKSTLDIDAPVPLGAWIYGWAQAESYGFTGGIYGALDSAAAQFTLAQSSSFAPVGTIHHVRAQLINEVGLLVPGARVDFAVAGANSVNGSGYTAADGSIEFSWQGAQAGTDTIIATAGGLTATATVTWLSNSPNQPPIVNAGADVIVRSGQPVMLDGLVQDDGLPANGQLTVQWSSLPGLGDVVFANPNAAQTTATFPISGQYRLRLTGFDGQFSGDDDLLVVVDAPPVFHSFQPSADAIDAGGQWSVDISASDPDGVLARVELLDGTQVVATEPPNQVRANIHLAANLETIGTHIMTVRLTDDFGLTTDRSTNVNVRPIPIVQILSPLDNTSIAAGDSVSFTASASSAGGPIVRIVYVDVTNYSYEIGDGTGSNYQLTWTPYYAGTLLIAATAYDSEGASGTSAPIAITVLSPGDPTVVITSPQEGSSFYVGQNATFHANATAVAPANVGGVSFFDGDDYLGSSYSPPYEIRWYAGWPGAHTLRTEVWDTFGGYATTSITVNVVEPPNLGITLVQPQSNIPIKVNTPTTLEASIENVIGELWAVNFYVNYQWIGDGSSSSVTWTPTAIGDYAVAIYAYSSNPNQEGYAFTTITVADLHSPVVEWTAPANNSSVPPNTPIVLQAQASDIDSNLAKLQFIADGQLLSETPLSGGAGAASCTWDNANPGWHALTALAVDDTIQSGGAFLRVFVERTVANDLLPPSALTSETTSANSIHLAWIASTSANVAGVAIERRVGIDGAWQEIATVDPATVTYDDTSLESETYCTYRLASVNAVGARSTYSEESSATTFVEMPTYAIVDITESLAQRGIANHFFDFNYLIASSVAAGTADPIELQGTRALSVNDHGEVLVDSGDGNYTVWRLQDQSYTTLAKGAEPIVARNISPQGIVAGSSDHSYQDPDNNVHLEFRAQAWINGAVNEITPHDSLGDYQEPRGGPARGLGDYEVFEAYGIADSGVVAGRATVYYRDYDYSAQHAALWSGNQWINLGGFVWVSDHRGRMLPSYATAVNGNQQVVGVSAIDSPQLPSYPPGTGPQHAFLSNGRNWDAPGRTFQDLGTLGGYESAAWDINAGGFAIGVSTKEQTDPAWRVTGFVWEGSGAMKELPTLGGMNTNFPLGYSFPLAINDQGRIVGQSLRVDRSTVAALWQKNQNNGAPSGAPPRYEALDLNDAVGSYRDWFLVNARDISNSGLIVGQGIRYTRDGQGQIIGEQEKAYLLIPIKVQITQPADQSINAFCDNVELKAEVSGLFAGMVTRVEYWAGNAKIAESTDPQGWPGVWIQPPKGNNPITARAFVGSTLAYAESRATNLTVLPISRRAVNFIMDAEVDGQNGYERRYRRPTWPRTRASGATIGIGYDLGQNVAARIRQDWQPFLPPDQVDRLVALAGIRGATASARLNSVADIDIPFETALQVYYQRTLPRFIADTLQVYPAAADLSPNSFGSLVSLIYNRGNSLRDADRNRSVVSDPAREMRDIAVALRDGTPDAVPQLLREMERIWRGTEDYNGLRNRRNNEASLFEQGLDPNQNQCD